MTELPGGTGLGRGLVCKNRNPLKTVLIRERSQRPGWAAKAARGREVSSLGSAELVVLLVLAPGQVHGAGPPLPPEE